MRIEAVWLLLKKSHAADVERRPSRSGPMHTNILAVWAIGFVADCVVGTLWK